MDLQTMENEVNAWRARFPQYEYRPLDDCVALKLEYVRYGCHVDLGVGDKPDGCVFDSGDIEDCINARRLSEQGKGKRDCGEWKPIDASF